MAQVVVATFASLTEAQIAAGALESGGLHPEIADQYFGAALWTDQFALQGFRLILPDDEAADASTVLASLRSKKVRRPPDPTIFYVSRLIAAPLVFVSPLFAWAAVAGLRRKRGGSASLFAVATALTFAGVASVGSLLVLAGGAFNALVLSAWPVLPLAAAVATAILVITSGPRRRPNDD
jgi:hypothetical protein